MIVLGMSVRSASTFGIWLCLIALLRPDTVKHFGSLMYRPLPAPKQRVVVDTNVLLNAAFLEGGSADLAIAELRRRGIPMVIDEAIENEAELVLSRLRVKLALNFNPFEIFKLFVRASGTLVLPRAGPVGGKHVNRADRHVIGAASKYGAWVLTGDFKLASECVGHAIEARLPMDAIIEGAFLTGRNHPLHLFLRVAGVSAKNGSFFARVIPGGWAGRPEINSKFTICHVENLGRLYYDSAPEEWVFSMALGNEVRLHCKIKPDEQWIVSASYDISEGKGNATLRAAQPGEPVSPTKNISINGVFAALSPGEITFGLSCAKLDSWNGHIRNVTISPVGIVSKAWRALVKVLEAAPDPSSGDVLEKALKLTRIEAGGLIRPTEVSLRSQWL